MLQYRCLVCGRIIKSNRPDALIDHLRHEHPFINVDRQRQNQNQNKGCCSTRTPTTRHANVKCGTPAVGIYLFIFNIILSAD